MVDSIGGKGMEVVRVRHDACVQPRALLRTWPEAAVPLFLQESRREALPR